MLDVVVDNTTTAMRRCWHAVALADEVGDGPVGVTLLGERWVLARLGSDGRVAAFPDRCPHRLAPLSAGFVEGGRLRCGYHGWCFDRAGACVDIPALGSEARIPARADLRPAAAVEERHGLVWLAPEEPLGAIPDFPEWQAGAQAGFDRMLSTVVRTPVSAAQLVDNFLDAAHFPYVHAATFGDEKAALVKDCGVDRDGWTVTTVFDSWYRNFDDPLVATGEHPELQPQRLLKQGHAGFCVYLRLELPVAGQTMGILFCCQPESASSTRVYKLIARDDYHGDPGRMAACVADEDRILSEDLSILERYERFEIHLDPRVEIHTKADRLSLGWRRLLADICDPARSAPLIEEQKGPAAAGRATVLPVPGGGTSAAARKSRARL